MTCSFAGLVGAGFLPSLQTIANATEPERRLRMAPTIVVHLLGGPPSKETFTPDPPGSPVEMRGAFGAIRTKVSGVYFSELWPELAKRNDQFALLRAVDSEIPEHMEAIRNVLSPGGSPYIGARLGKLTGADPKRPAPLEVYFRADPYFSGFEEHIKPRPFTISWDSVGEEGKKEYRPPVMEKDESLGRRAALLNRLEKAGPASTVDGEQVRSMTALRDFALELTTKDSPLFSGPFRHTGAELGRYGDNELGRALLIAQKMIALGVAHVTIVYGDWDWHSNLKDNLPKRTAVADKALAAFFDDNQRSVNPIALTVTGDFNRTPKMNSQGGRDHWRHGLNILLSGPKIQGGSVYGVMDNRGELPMKEVVTASRKDLINTIICGAGGASLVPRSEPRIESVLKSS